MHKDKFLTRVLYEVYGAKSWSLPLKEEPAVPQLYWDMLESPLGKLSAVLDSKGQVVALSISDQKPEGKQNKNRCLEVVKQLAQSFSGPRKTFELQLNPQGTVFQRRVWQALTKIPYGKTCGYGDLARRIEKPGAARAVGQANGANPIPIIIPCHRVIAGDGSIGGYTGGLNKKKILLALELAHSHPLQKP